VAYSLGSSSSHTHDYAVFGGSLRSEIPLPELEPTRCESPDWTFRRAGGPLAPSQHLGYEGVDAGVRVRCGRVRDGFRLEFDDTGVFDITDGGRLVEWSAAPTTPLGLVRADLVGGVFSVALHLQGLMCLHASAVAIGDSVIAFVAKKGTGKSTIAAAMCGAGARLFTDDMLPVLPDTAVTAWPSAPALRLLHDSASRLGYATGSAHPTSGKYHVSALHPDLVERRRLTLAAVYELSPTADDSNTPDVRSARRGRLSGVAAVATLLRHSRTGVVIGGSDSVALFERAVDITRSVPVYRLEMTRDFNWLSVVVERIKTWHTMSDSREAVGPGIPSP